MKAIRATWNGKSYRIANTWRMPYGVVHGLILTDARTTTNHRALYRRVHLSKIEYKPIVRASGNTPYYRKSPVRVRSYRAVC